MKDIILKPVITEKSIANGANNFYTFFVRTSANKYQIKQAVHKIFSVKVAAIQIINVKPKVKRRGRHIGTTRLYKKAVVKLQPDQKIDFFEKL
jgi:large subunit ribosomal protein L23